MTRFELTQPPRAHADLVDALPALVWTAAPGGSFGFVNKAWRDFTGRSADDELGLGWTAGIHPDDREDCLGTFRSAASAQRPFETAFRLHAADGSYRWMLARGAPRFDEQGDYVGHIGVCVDVQERKEAEAALEAAESLFRRLVENARDVVYRYRVSPWRGTEYISPAALSITGHSPEEFYADPDLTLKLVHPEDRPLLAQAHQTDPHELRQSALIRWIHSDGRIVWAEHRRVPICDDKGRMVAVEGVGRDVTDRIEASRRLEESESRFRLLAENARDFIYRYSVSPPRWEYISPASTAITGYGPQTFYDDPDLPWKVVHPDDHWILSRLRDEPRLLKEPVLLRWCHPEGRTVHIEHRHSPIYDRDGKLIAIEGIGRDMTQQFAIQTRLRDSERQLRQLAARVQDAREAERTHLARELHDELGQSLTAIKLELSRTMQVLLKKNLGPELIDCFQSLVGGVEVATETVRRLATSLRPPALDHLGLVAAIELEAAALARRTGIRCRVSGNRRIGPIDSTESTAIFRIVQEGLTNAVRHAGASAVTISIHGTSTSATVKIQDNGRGMTIGEGPNLIGLGLLGMHERAEMIGARLTITSSPGKGTMVRVVLTRGSANKSRRGNHGPHSAR